MKCAAKRSNGQPCGSWAIKGATVCRTHGGRAPQVRAKARERLETQRLQDLARREVSRLGVPVEADPAEALLGLIAEAAGNVEFYRQLVAELSAHPEPDVRDGDGWQRGASGVYGRTYHVSGVPTGEGKPHVLVTLYDSERDRLARLVETALRLGLDERRVRVAESDARRLFTAVVDGMGDVGLSGEQGEALRRAIAARLRDPAG